MKKGIRTGVFVCLLLVLAAVFGLPQRSIAAEFSFDTNKVVLRKGKTASLKVKGASQVRATEDASDSLGEQPIIRILKNGRVKGIRPGIAYVPVTADGKKTTCTVVVKPARNALKIRKTKHSVRISNSRFILNMPSYWRRYGIYILKSTDRELGKVSYSFYSRRNFLSGYPGKLFTVAEVKSRNYRKAISEEPGFRYRLGRKNGRTYYLTEPTDVQFNPAGGKYLSDYQALRRVLSESFKDRFTLR